MFGLSEIGLGAGGKRAARQRRHSLIRRHAFALIDRDAKDAAPKLFKSGRIGQRLRVEPGIGANAGGRAFLCRTKIVGRDKAHRSVTADL